MYMCLLMSSVIINCRCSIGGFPVGVNWVSGRALVSIFVCGGVLGFLISLSCWFGVMLSKMI